MAIYYFQDWEETATRKTWQFWSLPATGLFLFHSPSECRMFIPGNYQQMMEDYG